MNACKARGGIRGGGTAVCFRPDTKSGGGGGGGGGGVLSTSCPIRKAGGGGGGEREMLSASGPIRKVGGGGLSCLPYDDLYLRLCARAWGAGLLWLG